MVPKTLTTDILEVQNKQVIIMDTMDIVDEGYPIVEGKDVYFIDSADPEIITFLVLT